MAFSGYVDAVVVWWNLFLDEDRDIRLSTHPKWIDDVGDKTPEIVAQGWRDHWKQCWAAGSLEYVQVGWVYRYLQEDYGHWRQRISFVAENRSAELHSAVSLCVSSVQD